MSGETSTIYGDTGNTLEAWLVYDRRYVFLDYTDSHLHFHIENSLILAPYGSSLVTSSLSHNDNVNNLDRSPATSDFPVESKDVMVGMRKLEDSAADIDWQYDQTKGLAYSNKVQIGGVTMNKSWAIVQQFRYVTSASSTNRLQHVQTWKDQHTLFFSPS